MGDNRVVKIGNYPAEPVPGTDQKRGDYRRLAAVTA